MSTIKLSVSRGDCNITVEGDRDEAREELDRLAAMHLDGPTASHGEESSAEKTADSFAEFYKNSKPKRGTQGLIAAKYLTDVLHITEIRIADFKSVLEEVGVPPLSMPARANLVAKGWLERPGRGRYIFTDTGRGAYDKLVEGASLRELPVSEVKKQRGKRGGILSKYKHANKPTNIITCLINEKGPIDFSGISKLYDKAFGKPPANLKLLLNNMTGSKIGTAKLASGNYTLTDKGNKLVKSLRS